MSPTRRAFLLALTILAPFATTLAAAADLPPIAAFFDNPRMIAARISPDGKRLAVLFNNEATHGRDQVSVINLADNSAKAVAGFSDADVAYFDWVNDTRIVYTSRDKDVAPGVETFGSGLYAVNVDGSQQRQLVQLARHFITEGSRLGREILPPNTYLLRQPGTQDSNAVYVEQVDFGHDGKPDTVYLLKLDTVSGFNSLVHGPGGHTRGWLLDAQGKPAVTTTVEDDRTTLHFLDPKTGEWNKLATGKLFIGARDGFNPLGFAPDGTFYVEGRHGRDKRALYAYDLANGKLADHPLIDMPEYDFNGGLVNSNGKLLGVHYLADAQGTVWFDAGMKDVQAAVDKLLPGRINLLSVGVRSTTPFVLVDSWSDRQPTQFALYNRDTGKLSKIGESRPAIHAAQMAPLDLVQVKARDGQAIPTWLTVPQGGGKGKKQPMVVLVHGGPYMRGSSWHWGAERQFLASRGYVVLEPEFRGSTGFGLKHFQSGWKQWGLGMQDDIADATRWAIAEGIADPQRICIAGASYGGYATLMGLVRDPDLYKCGVDWVGVTDIDLLFTGHWSADDDTGDAYRKYGMPTLIGDPVKDAAQFEATSPLQQAAHITQPLLLAYGGADRRVPIYHGRKFYDAVKAANKHVEWVVYNDEGHGWKLVQTRLDFWGRVEKFLQQQIGGQP